MTVPIHGRQERPSGGDWLQRYRESVMNTFGDPKRVLVHGEGAELWDADGNRYLDLFAGIAVNSLGHAHPRLVQAVHEQMSSLGHISNVFTSMAQIELAEKLISLVGKPARVFFSNSGTESNEAALKITRRTGRSKIVAAEGGFHGRTLGALSLTANRVYREPFEPLPGNVSWVPYGDLEALRAAVDSDTAAVVLEPIQGEAGVIDPPAGYLAAARELTAQQGALLWMDEVQTGIARTGDWFGYQSAGVNPDIITLGKGLAGGIPIGACLGIGDAAKLLGPGQHGSTFGGNPIATRAALTVLETIESDDLLGAVQKLHEVLREGFAAIDGVREVTGRGLLLGLVLDREIAQRIADAALDAGVIVNAVKPDRIRIAPPLVLSVEQADGAVATLSKVIQQVRQ